MNDDLSHSSWKCKCHVVSGQYNEPSVKSRMPEVYKFAWRRTPAVKGISEAAQKLFNSAMRIKRKDAPYQRTEDQTGYADVFKERHLQSRAAEFALQIPLTRDAGFFRSCLERGLRSERAIRLAMYIQGVAVRSVRIDCVQSCAGLRLSSAQAESNK